VSAGRVIIIDCASGEVLLEKNANQRGQVASTQKLLTALIIAKRGELEQPVPIAGEDTDCEQVKCGLAADGSHTRRELLTVMLVKSANDAALALARDHSGNVPEFAAEMNRWAQDLGMTQSHFTNPSGLPDERQFSTARDMATLAMAVDRVPVLKEIVGMKTYDWRRSDGTVAALQNTNSLLHTYGPCDGMKTGFTNAAGYCLISSGGMHGRRRIVVALNNIQEKVWHDSQELLGWSLNC
jgi:D-alanyl-D-alanine carboxypeptidase (penicillin-binding protein 5/6)